MLPTPIFLISYNRPAMLERTIAGIRMLGKPNEIVIHDNGSDDPDTLGLLRRLEESGIQVGRNPRINDADELNNVDHTVQAYFANRPPCSYAVSDCDIDMSIADPRALDMFDELLWMFPRMECVGPMLRIRDIPRAYPLFASVMNRHIEQFWSKTPTVVRTLTGEAAILECVIDTTFALHRAGSRFRRLKRGLRVYEPFEARHLDWYEADGSSLLNQTSPISHWANKDLISRRRGDELKYKSYNAVRQGESGSLELYVEHIAGA